MKKTVAIIGTNGLPSRYGRFETLVNYLVKNFDKNTYDLVVYCSKTSKKDRLNSYNGAKLIYFPFKANGWQSIIYDFITIIHAFFNASDLIVLGFSGAFAFPLNNVFKKNIVFNIGGIEWKKVRGVKFTAKVEIFIKKFMEKLCVKNSNTVIIDNLAFNDYIQKTYGVQPVLAEYGGDHTKNRDLTSKLIDKYSFLNSQYALSISRAQEDMNIHLLIEAYKKLPQNKIVIISNWHISKYGQNLHNEYFGKYSNIVLENAIYDLGELDTIRSHAYLYIHTHSLCGTAPSLVEAMSLNIPVISYDAPTNRYTTENKTMYFSDILSLIKILKKLNSKKILEIKKNMLEISKRRYVWKRISRIYQNNLSLK